MPDITMCQGIECPYKLKCYRHNATPSEHRQAYFTKVPYDKGKNKCDFFILVKGNTAEW